MYIRTHVIKSFAFQFFSGFVLNVFNEFPFFKWILIQHQSITVTDDTIIFNRILTILLYSLQSIHNSLNWSECKLHNC